MDKELRYSNISSNNENDKEMIVEGYAIVFNQKTPLYEYDGKTYYEIIDRNALQYSDLEDVCLKYNHGDSGKILARTKNETLKLSIDNKGLFIRAKLANTTDGRDLYELVKRKDLDKMSFAFTVADDYFNRDTNTRNITSIKKVYEVSIVDTPAYEGTSIIAKRFKSILENKGGEKSMGMKKSLNLIEKKLSEIQFKEKELRSSDHIQKDDLENLEIEKNYLISKEKELRQKIKLAEELEADAEAIEDGRGEKKQMEKRTGFAKELQEKRTALLSSNVLIPKKYHDQIQPKFNEVSGILDLVNVMYLEKGKSITVPYVKNNSMGNITDEAAEYGDTKSEFGQVEIDGIKITAYTQYSEEVEKQPTADYEVFITNEITKSINKKIIHQIVNGNGIKQFSGLYHTEVATTESDLTISTIDNTTLNKIVYGHNTEAEEVEGNMVLFLNKKDLGEFANIQSTDGKPVYNITYGENGMTGHINGTKFCICNSLKPFKEASTGEYTMAYLDPSKYMVTAFSPIELKKDYSSGFRQGLIAVKGSVIIGGSLVSPYAITRVKKGV